ncbi:hypothetical protein RFG51_002800 [Klebsiella aerogenes]|nr:hypothetical protein [Klebsiella aerogenes]
MQTSCSALSVVVNAQADALAAKVYFLQRNLMRVKLAIRQSVSHRNEGKPDISTGHHSQIHQKQNRCSSLPFPQYFGLQPSAHFLKRTSTKNQT